MQIIRAIILTQFMLLLWRCNKNETAKNESERHDMDVLFSFSESLQLLKIRTG